MNAHYAMVNWGDGSISAATVDDILHTVLATHTYGEEGTYHVVLTVSDQSTGSAGPRDGSASTSVTVASGTPTLLASWSFDSTLTQNTQMPTGTINGSFSDPGFTSAKSGKTENFTTTINWGDGTATQTVANTLINGSPGTPTTGTFNASHTYHAAGLYTATVTVTDDDGGSISKQLLSGIASIKVRNSINLKSGGDLVVWIYKSGINTSLINSQSLRFGPGGAPLAQGLDGNGPNQVVAHFDTQTSAIRPTDTAAYLVGQLTDGTPFVGVDPSIRIVPGSQQGRSGNIPRGVTPQFFVADPSTNEVYRYTSSGGDAGYFPLDGSVTRPKGLTADATGQTIWAIDGTSGAVAVSDSAGHLYGSWLAAGTDQSGSLTPLGQPTGLAVAGSNLWILDGSSKRVFRYAGAAVLVAGVPQVTAGMVAASSSFALNAANANPTDVATDGNNVWVVDGTAKKVFVYDNSGNLLGQWTLDPGNTNPSGITLTPGSTDLWVVDKTAKAVFGYQDGASWRGGTHHPSSSRFPLVSADGSPEAIADPPTLTMGSTPPSLTPGTPEVVSGHVSPNGSPVTGLTVNGVPPTVLDAAGNFFVSTTAPPTQTTNTLSVVASDASGPSTASLTLTGAATGAGAVDFSRLADLSGAVTATYGLTSFDDQKGLLFSDLTVKNIGTADLHGPLLVAFKNISDRSIRVADPDGFTPDGIPYYNLTSLLNGGAFTAGTGTITRTIEFFNPSRDYFTYQLVVLAHRNSPPVFSTVPVVQVAVGGQYSYSFTARDPDGDPLTSSFSGPSGMSLSGTGSTGTLTWAPTSAGTYNVSLQENDGNGGITTQTFAITVSDGTANHPPVFTSTPVVDANVNAAYAYQTTAFDADGDPVQFSVASGTSLPSGMSLSSSGLVSWTPTASQIDVGQTSKTYTVSLKVVDLLPGTNTPRDANNSYAVQVYHILLQQALGNHPPHIDSTPVTSVQSGQTYTYVVHAIDADNDTISYSFAPGTTPPSGMTINSSSGIINWPNAPSGQSPTLTVAASDGKGGSDTQTFSIGVLSTASGEIDGYKFNDANGNGSWDYSSLMPGVSNSTGLRYFTTIPDTDFVSAGTGGVRSNDGTGVINLSGVNGPVTHAFLYWNGPTSSTNDNINANIMFAGVSIAGSDIGSSGDNFWTDPTTNAEYTRSISYRADVTSQVHGNGLYSLANLIKSGSPGAEIDGVSLLVFFNGPSTTTKRDVVLLDGNDSNEHNVYDPDGWSLTATGINYTSGSVSLQLHVADGQATNDPALTFSGLGGNQTIAQGQIWSGTTVPNGPIQDFGGGLWDIKNFDLTSLLAPGSSSNYLSITSPVSSADVTSLVVAALSLPADSQKEPALPGWTIYLDLNHNGRLDPGEASTVTDSTGHYSFAGIAPGTYWVAEVPQSGWKETYPNGEQQITISAGQSDSNVNFGNEQVVQNNRPPVFTNLPSTTATLGTAYSDRAVATDPDGDPVTYDLPLKPAGMAIDASTGVIYWNPTSDQVGPQNLIIRAQDGHNGVASVPLTITVTAPNAPPVFMSVPKGPALVGHMWQYILRATDADAVSDNETLTFALDTAHTTNSNIQFVSINNGTQGYLTFTPQASDAGHTYTVEVTCNDGHSTTVQTFSLPVVNAPAQDDGPQIFSTPGNLAQVNRRYVYNVLASDTDGEALRYSLTGTPPSGMSIDSVAGILTWTPTTLTFDGQTIPVTLRVAEASNPSVYVEQSFALRVVSTLQNQPPTITSTPRLIANAQEQYVYQAQASDPDGDPLTWNLDTAPVGMTIDPLLGTIVWTPAAQNVGAQQIELRVVDNQGSFATQAFTLQVRGADAPPQILSTPPTQAVSNVHYTYPVLANDPDGDALTYTLGTGAPSGMGIDSSGVVTWTPGGADAGTTKQITVNVSDGYYTASQLYSLVVLSALDHPPTISSTPDFRGTTGQNYTYPVIATDPDVGQTLSYSASTSPAVAMTFNGSTLTWSNAAAGTYNVSVSVSDGAGGTATQSYALTISAGNPPTIVTPPDQTIAVGAPFSYSVQASDFDHVPLIYSLTTFPAGMSIDANGTITWTPQYDSSKTYPLTNPITVQVEDDRSATATATFNVIVSNSALTVSIQSSPAVSAPVNTSVTFFVSARDAASGVSDSAGMSSLSLGYRPHGNGAYTPITLDANGIGVLSFTSSGVYDLEATATDSAGNVSTTTSTFTADAVAAGAPTATISGLEPSEGGDPQITSVSDPNASVGGTVSDSTIFNYTLTLTPIDGGASITLASGTNVAAGTHSVSAQIDPTSLADGTYLLTLTTTDGGASASDQRTIAINAPVKLGNVHLSFTDLSVPVAGLPVSIVRTYDSLNSGGSEDFGFGWTLEYRDVKLQTSELDPGTQSGFGNYPGFATGTRVWVTLPGGRREMFTFDPQPWGADAVGIMGLQYLEPNYLPQFDPGPGVTDKLSVDTDYLQSAGNGQWIDAGTYDAYNPANPEFGGHYILTTKDGLKYDIDATNGLLSDITEPNGSKVSFSDTAITATDPAGDVLTGSSITINRDYAGRISSIVDPANASITYSYSPTGDLVAVTDRANTTTTYGYGASGAPPHYLTSITDGRGVAVLTTQYSPTTHQLTLVDANGNPVTDTYSSSGANPSDTVTNPLGYQSVVVYDNNGNVIRQVSQIRLADPAHNVSATYSVVVGEYDTNNDVTATSKPFTSTGTIDNALSAYVPGYSSGDPNHPDPTLHPTAWAQRATYDSFGNLLTSTDALGNTTQSTYNQFGEPLSVVDAAGNVTISQYDDEGNLTQSQDAAGNVSSYAYNNGNQTAIFESGTTQLFSYDTQNRLKTSTDATGKTNTFGYDANGNQNITSYQYSPAGGGPPVTVSTSTTYDSSGRVTQAFGADGSVTSTTYDDDGQVIETVQTIGITRTVTDNSYDKNGNLVRTKSPNGTEVRMIYDAAGQMILATDPFKSELSNPDPAVPATSTLYDGTGRVIGTQRLTNVTVTFSADEPGIDLNTVSATGTFNTELTGTPAIIYQTSTIYNTDGTVASDTDRSGHTTTFGYDVDGHRTQVTDSLGHTTIYQFDTAGRQTLLIDPLGYRTTSQYDANGNVVKTTYDDGSSVTEGYDALGRHVSQTDPAGVTTSYAYDAAGRLTAVIEPQVNDARVSGDPLVTPTTSYTYDAYGNLLTQTDADSHVTSFTYDALGNPITRTLPSVAGVADAVFTQAYDSNDRVTLSTDADGNTTQTHYDGLGRVDTLTYTLAGTQSPAETVGYHYNNLGQQDVVTDDVAGQTADTSYSYDVDGNLTMVISPQGTIHYVYDPVSGNHIETWTGTGADDTTSTSDISYSYDVLGRLATVTALRQNNLPITPNQVSSYSYDADGNLTKLTLPNGTETDYTYDDLNRNISVTNKGPSGVLSSYTYGYSPDGLKTSSTEMLNDNGTISTKDTLWTYDALKRLTSETVRILDANGNDQADPSDYSATYTYDPVGNRMSKIVNPPFDISSEATITYSYDARDRLVTETSSAPFSGNFQLNYSATYGYDQNGAQTTRTYGDSAGENETDTYGYDARGRLSTAQVNGTSITYGYDDAGNIIAETADVVSSQYLIDINNPTGYAQIIEDRTKPGAQPLQTTSYVIGDRVLSQQTTGIGTYWLMPDGQGSTRLLTTSSGTIAYTFAYDAFGNGTNPARGFQDQPSSSSTTMLYTGERFDQPLNQYYWRFRPYAAADGRFSRADDIGLRPGDLANANRYVYVGGNPVNLIDPSGHEFNLTSTLIATGISTVLDAILSPVVKPVMAYLARAFIPSWLTSVLQSGPSKSTVLRLGFTVAPRVPKVPLLSGYGGGELLTDLRKKYEFYLYGGAALIGGGDPANFSGYVGFVSNIHWADEYDGVRTRISVGLNLLPIPLRNALKFFLLNAATGLAGAPGLALPGASAGLQGVKIALQGANRASANLAVLVNRLVNNAYVSFDFSPSGGASKPIGVTVLGIQVPLAGARQILTQGSGGNSISLAYYQHIYPTIGVNF